jgi:outer membrane biosynthesis protein TonB
MRAPAFIVSFVQWRWTPSVALVVGSLAFVGIAVLVVPDDFGAVTSGADRMSRTGSRNRMGTTVEPAADTSSIDEEAPSAPGERHTAALPRKSSNIVHSIFHPVQKTELPVEPVDPNPPPPPPEVPPPPPTNTIYTLPTPPPPSPNPLAVPAEPPAAPPPAVVAPAEAPVEPQGITGKSQ